MEREQLIAIMSAILFANNDYSIYSDRARRKEAAVQDAVDLLNIAEDYTLPNI